MPFSATSSGFLPLLIGIPVGHGIEVFWRTNSPEWCL